MVFITSRQNIQSNEYLAEATIFACETPERAVEFHRETFPSESEELAAHEITSFNGRRILYFFCSSGQCDHIQAIAAQQNLEKLEIIFKINVKSASTNSETQICKV